MPSRSWATSLIRRILADWAMSMLLSLLAVMGPHDIGWPAGRDRRRGKWMSNRRAGGPGYHLQMKYLALFASVLCGCGPPTTPDPGAAGETGSGPALRASLADPWG